MWNFRSELFCTPPCCKTVQGRCWRTFLGSGRTIVACLPTIHWLTLSMAAPISEPKQTPCAALWCSSPPFGCLPPPPLLSPVLLPEPKWLQRWKKKPTLRKEKIIELDVVYVGDVDRGCWQKLHLICYWFFFIIKICYQETTWLIRCYLLRIVSGTLLEINSDPTWTNI